MTDTCTEMRLLIQADLDGELTPAEAARVATHLDACAACRGTGAALQSLSASIRAEAGYHPAPEVLRRAIAATAVQGTPGAAPAVPARRPWQRQRAAFGAGFALAACLALAVVLPRQDDGLTDSVVAGHIRSLQPGHLMDVASSDQHTVKPWFDGRLNFAPPVKDLAADGFPLTGGRLDYLDGREVAALLYRSRQHVVQLFVWPGGSTVDRGPAVGARQGYNLVRWSQDGMAFWVVSDLNAAELGDFVRLWRRS